MSAFRTAAALAALALLGCQAAPRATAPAEPVAVGEITVRTGGSVEVEAGVIR